MERPISQSTPKGFTLIELLVVVAIISVLAVGATLAVGRSGSSGQSDRALFAKTHERMRGLAVSGQQVRGLRFDPRGMFTADYGTKGWDISETRISWAGRVAVDVPGSARNTRFDVPQVIYLPTGRTTAYSIRFQDGSSCQTDGWGPLTCQG
ncbi:type II secretion system protein [Thalassovita sp.]|jgi:prepilin-type N-terminal cleavage/methylation domain-containing protein|uniref:type II secretion system protein n=1 Tax=Thalassovita sp. TaxID=1979401 RepID=UPI003B596C46